MDMADRKKKQANDLHSLRREFHQRIENMDALLKRAQARTYEIQQRLALLEQSSTQNQQ